MAFDLNDLLAGVRASRQHFLKHLQGLGEDQWDWKPYPECKSIRETVIHLVGDDRAALQSLNTGQEPTYDAIMEEVGREAPSAVKGLLGMLERSHEALCAEIERRYAGSPLDTVACIYGSNMKLAAGIPHLSSEDFYHAGQVAFARMASDPAWDYYGAVYGPEG